MSSIYVSWWQSTIFLTWLQDTTRPVATAARGTAAPPEIADAAAGTSATHVVPPPTSLVTPSVPASVGDSPGADAVAPTTPKPTSAPSRKPLTRQD